MNTTLDESPQATAPSATRPLKVALASALAYAAVGLAALLLAGPPGYASPLYPPAGIALAATFVFGRAAFFGTWLGSFVVNASLGALRGPLDAGALVLPGVIGLGAALQAALGAWLVRRYVAQPLVLIEPRDIALTAGLGAFVACLVSPTVATLALVATGTVAVEGAAGNWLTWWVGDTLGTVIAAPVAWAFIGRPAQAWRPRRASLVLPSLTVLALLAAAIWAIAERERGYARAALERDTDLLAASVQQRLQLPVHALQALVAAVGASGQPDTPTLRAAATWWVRPGSPLQAMGYSEWVPVSELGAFEAAARGEGLADFRVTHRDGGRAPAADGGAVVIRRIEPIEGNAAALGTNALSIPEVRAAIEATRRSGVVAASRAFRLSQSTRDEAGLVLYQALSGLAASGAAARATLATPTTPATQAPQTPEATQPAGAEAAGSFRGVLFVALRAEALLAGLPKLAGAGSGWCLVDPDPLSARTLLAGAATCAGASAPQGPRRRVQLADREFELRVTGPLDLAGGPTLNWLLTVAAFGAAAMLGAWLLTITGQALRTRRAVDAATGELRREVAERRAAERERAASEARLRSILDHAPLGIAFLDPHGKLLQGNPHLFRMLGAPEEQLLGRRVASVVRPEDLPALEREHLALLTGRVQVVRREMRLARGDGEALTVRMASTALRNDHGRVQYMVAVIEDLTEHLQLERAERARQRAEAANRTKSEFVSRMSHELRTPLNAMLGFAQLLGLDREPALAERQRGWVLQIQRAGWHLLELVNDTLDLARIESGAIQLQTQPVDLAQLVAGCVDLVGAGAAARRIDVRVELEAGLPPALADPTRLKQVVTNLLSNAVKYNREGGQVTVRAAVSAAPAMGHGATEGARVTVEVSDTGLGMTAAQMVHLFEPYNRLGREGGPVEGTGIGLVISRRLTEMMGGTLRVQSRAGVGSSFSLELPAAPGAVADSHGPPLPEPAPYRRRCVLYIEDNETNVEVMRGMLLQRPQVRLEVALLGLDGLAAAKRLRPDLILLDMQLPDITGPELLRHLMADDETATIPVMVVSADATPARVEQALTLGALQYITKPVAVAPFLKALDEVLDSMETRL